MADKEPEQGTGPEVDAAKLAQKLLGSNVFIKRHAAAAFASIMTNHFVFQSLQSEIRRQDDTLSERQVTDAAAAIFKVLEQEAAAGMNISDLIGLLEQAKQTLTADLHAHTQGVREVEKQRKADGYPVLFQGVQNISGPLKPGRVLVLSADSVDSLAAAYDILMSDLLAKDIPITRFNLAMKIDKESSVLGVTDVPRSWWGGAADSYETLKDAFKAVDTPVLFIDNADALSTVSDDKRGKRIRKALMRAAKRVGVSIVCGALTADLPILQVPNKLHTAEVGYRKVDGKSVLFIENVEYKPVEQKTEETDDGNDTCRGNDRAKTELAGPSTGTEDGEPKGPGEDSGKGSRVAGPRLYKRPEAPADE